MQWPPRHLSHSATIRTLILRTDDHSLMHTFSHMVPSFSIRRETLHCHFVFFMRKVLTSIILDVLLRE